MPADRSVSGADRRWERAFGWQELRRDDFVLGDGTGLNRRWLALADVPDLDLLPASLPGRPSVVFRAGNESALQVVALVAADLAGAMVRNFDRETGAGVVVAAAADADG